MSKKPTKAKRYAMTMDTRLCVGCGACVLSCKAENNVPDTGARDWIVVITSGRFPTLHQEIRSERCNHCSDAPCVTNCPTGASYIGDGGAVIIDQRKCSGCKACIAACPYGARYVHPDGYVDKCTFCLHRVRRGLLPGCVDICPTGALTFGDLNDAQSPVTLKLQSRRNKVLKPEQGLKPNLFFLTD